MSGVTAYSTSRSRLPDRAAPTTRSGWNACSGRHPGGRTEPDGVVQDNQLTTRLTAPSRLGSRAQRQLDRCRTSPTPATTARPGRAHPIKQPSNSQVLAPDDQTYNMLLRTARRPRGTRRRLLTGRWSATSLPPAPRRIGNYVKAALVLTLIEASYALPAEINSLPINHYCHLRLLP